MPDAVVERIAQELATRIARVTTANGYTRTVTVSRPTRLGGYSPKDMLAVLEQGEATKNDDLTIAGNPQRIAWDQLFAISVYVRPSDTSTTPVDTQINNVAADIIKEITKPAATWHSFGGLAISADWLDPMLFVNDTGTNEGTGLRLSVTYRVPENDPYTVG